MADFETWENVAKGRIQIWKMGRQGQPEAFVLPPGGKVTLTPEDRLYNQDIALTEFGDFFRNGTLMPVRLVDTAVDYAEVADNPNHLAQSDIEDLIKAKVADLRVKLAEITNPVTMARIHEIADEMDLTASKRAAVEERYAELCVPKNEGISAGVEDF